MQLVYIASATELATKRITSLGDHHLRLFEGSCSGFNWHQVYLVSNVEYRIKTPKIMLFGHFPSGAGQKT